MRICAHKVPTVSRLSSNLRSENDTLSLDFHWIWGQKMTKFTKWKKWQKLIQGLYPNHMHISRPWRKHVQSFKKISIKLYEELRSQGTHCHNIFIESEVRKWQSSQSGKSNKNKCKDYIQTICTSSHHEENMCKVSKRSVKNCKRSCTHKTPMGKCWRMDGRMESRNVWHTKKCYATFVQQLWFFADLQGRFGRFMNQHLWYHTSHVLCFLFF